ncbi:MAG: hypothetical protein M3068_04495 [Gemmatimonadota bacterium]|nr:hypothetical protein [Gemmatimonadota bacterium]
MHLNGSGDDLFLVPPPSLSPSRRVAGTSDDGTGLGADLVADIRQRVARGDYDTPSVLEHVVRRIVERGDL